MGKKLNYEYILNYVNNNTTAKLLSTEYKDSKTKLNFKCECDTDFERTWSKFRHSNRYMCLKCLKESKPSNKGIPEIKILEHFKETGSKFVSRFMSNGKTFLNVECFCGKKYSQSLQSFKRSPNKVCKECSDKLKGIVKRNKLDIVYKELDSYGVQLLDEYTGIDKDLNFRCSCGRDFKSTLWKIRISKNKMCNKCVGVIRGLSYRKGDIKFIRELEISRPYIKLIGEFNGMGIETEFKFKDCGHINVRKPRDIVKHKNTQCTTCRTSRGESKIESFLVSNNIEYIKQKTFEGCFNLSRLRFDFYLPKYNTCIEFQGEFHFERERIKRGESVLGGFSEFLVSKKRDLIKKKFCRISKVLLLEIMYYEMDNINKILKYSLKI